MSAPDPPPASAAFQLGRMVLAALGSFGGHAVVIAGAFIAGQLAKPSRGGGFEDLGAVVVTFFLGEALLTLACIVAGIVMFGKGRRDTALGVALGWLVGVLIFALLQTVAVT